MQVPREPLRLRLFGRARVFVGSQEITWTAPPRTLPLLAYIVLARRPVERAELAAALWPERSGDDGLANVRRHLHALHRNLRGAGIATALVAAKDGYLRLDAAVPFTCDIGDYERLARDDATLDEAVALYSGDLLASFDDAWIAPERERFRAEQCRNCQRLAGIARARGDGNAALRAAQTALALEPWNEELARAVLLLHWEFEDRAGATRTYASFVERTRNDLDAAPSAALRQLADTIHSGAAYRRPGYWPAEFDLTTFFGRGEDLERLSTIATERRAVILTGPPGVGKTRLALKLARRLETAYRDGFWFVDLSAVRHGNAIEPAIIDTLCKGGERANESLREMLSGKSLVLVIDNCEHVSRGASAAIERIAAHARAVFTIATSRRVLDVRGAATWAVRPLPVPGAGVDLFIDRARVAIADAQERVPTPSDAADLCAKLDGLPLALELAAARLRSIPFEELAARLGERFDLLASDDDRAGRSSALRTTFDWSYSLLDEGERAFFHSLAAFRGGWTVTAAASIAGVDEWRALRLLGQLIAKSFVIPPQSASAARYDMLQSLREYALLATDPDVMRRNRERHATYYASLRRDAGEHGDAFAIERQTDYSAIAADFDNVRAALHMLLEDDFDPQLGVDLVCGLGFFWVDSVPWLESRRWLDAAVRSDVGTARQRVALHVIKSRFALRRGDAAEAHDEAALAVRCGDDLEDGLLRARALMARSRAAWMMTELPSSLADAEAALELCLAADNLYGRARALSTLYLPLISAGDVERANDAVTTAAELYRSLEAPVELAEALANLGTCAYYRSDIAMAATHYREALALVRDTKNDRTIAFIAHNLASVAWECGDPAEAWLHISSAMAIAMRIGYPSIVVRSVELVARWCVTHDPYEAALLGAAAAAGSERHDARFQKVERDDHERLAASVEAALTREEIGRAHAEGSALMLASVAERAIGYADRMRRAEGLGAAGEALAPREPAAV